MSWCSAADGGLRIAVQLAPNARQNEICGVHDDALRIRLQAQPIEGRANEALLRFLADRLSVPKSAVTLLHGQTSKRKVVRVAAPLSVADAEGRLLSG
ncbi:DUF167 domain-containing protein [Noviherbaspirillum aridicola]|uniref:UPF0235 protein NCCP691_09970 n=1 Tax=Noviherbaspirillum aridicola TaxID=2849687 RepID=A0ABQ4Q1L7_9BURK|nr:DUF167 domain-containing protein [Noviherbaspirillum aridicola]GIZ50983.1 hypothetical protein NCCP691_09970 [Noviherbaspirillum aridicola]